MSTKWTVEQEKAISIRNCNTLVSAAAGSGKTAVLVQRVIDMITDEKSPVYINELLIATFTNAAAAEMQERIYTSLRNKIAENPDSTFLKEQLVLLGQAQISTIHSFCMNLLRENFHLLGIRRDFDIADDVKVSVLKNNALNIVLERNYVTADMDFLNTVDAFGGKKNDDNLSEIIMSVYKFTESLPDSAGWLKNNLTKIGSKESIENYKKIIFNSLKEKILSISEEYKTALEIIESDDGLESYEDIYSNEFDFFINLGSADSLSEFKLNLLSFEFKRLKTKKGSEPDPDKVKKVKNIRTSVKNKLEKVKESAFYTDEEIENEIAVSIPYINTISNLVIEFGEVFSELKLQENLLDFSDLEHFAIKLLEENDDIRLHLQDFYKEILVDEYQDTNGVQAYLFELLSNGKNLFMVGDVKQSIYGFRNSNPEFFIEKYNSYDSEYNTSGTRINLAKNFRSSNAVINIINEYFENLMIDELGGVSYDANHALVYGNNQIKDVDSPVERYIIDMNTSDEENTDENEIDEVQAEAIFVANRIRRMVEDEEIKIYDKITDSYRNVMYKDIVILMRKTKWIASVYADVLTERGIPVYTAESKSYFNCIEIATVMSFLKIIENPLQDIPLLAVIRSPVFGFDDNLIAEIRAENRKTHFFYLLKKSKHRKAVEFIKQFEMYREFARYNNVGSVVRKIIFDTGYYQFTGGLTNGKTRMINLDLLCEKANDFSSKGFKSISEFISFVSSMIESGNEYSSPKLINENDNVVNIMSIHKSKGLEFPVVFLCESGLSFNKKDLNKPIVFDKDMGISVNIIDSKRHLTYVPYVKKAVSEKKNTDLISEEIRLLYVALTRAKYKLIITGIKKSTLKNTEHSEASAYRIKLKNTYLEMLLAKLNGVQDAEEYNINQILEMDSSVIIEDDELTTEENSYNEFYGEISDRLNYNYQFESSRFIPSKKSISEIISNNEITNLKSLSCLNSGLTSAQRGTLIHFVLQNINLENVEYESDIEFQLNSMIEKGVFDAEYKDIIDSSAIFNFFQSDIGKRMLASKKVYREFKFCVDFPADELGYNNTSNETILVQGVIDCCFEEEDGFVIIDYKTGSLKEKYQKQLELYKRCLEISTGKNVKETHIYPLI